jgi:serine/threonine-protein kinase
MTFECPHCAETVERLSGPCPRCRGDLAGVSRPDELLGQRIADNFELLAVIGTGAMGRVYRARQVSLDKTVAIKLLHPHLAQDPKLAKRFHREARAASRLNHSNSLQIIDFGQDAGGRMYIAMEFLEGLSLAKVIQRDFPFSASRIARILGQTCDALEEAHAVGIIHRDLKPENILVQNRRGEPDHVKVCDFGIAKIQDPGEGTDAQLTMAGLVCGTPEYMSPEQARGDALDGRSDVYALGVIGYQMLCGEVPFSAQTALGVITKHLTDSVVPPSQRRPDLSVPPALERVFVRALAKDRVERQASAAALKSEILEALSSLTSPDARPAEGEPPSMRKHSTVLSGELVVTPRRHGAGLWIAGVLGLVLVGAGVFIATRAGQLTRVEPVAASFGSSPSAPSAVALPPEPSPLPGPAVAAPPVPEVAPPPEPTPAEPEVAPPVEPAPAEARPERAELARPRGRLAKAPRPPPAPSAPVAEPAAVSPGRAAYDAGRALFLSGQYAQAIQRYREAERLGFGGPALYRSLAQAYSRTGNTAAMCDAYRRVLRANPNDMLAQGVLEGQCR